MASVLVIGLNFFYIFLLAGCQQTESTHIIPALQSSKASDGLSTNVVEQHDTLVGNRDTAHTGAELQKMQLNTSLATQHVRRTRRSAASDAAVAGLNILGILISIGSAGFATPFLVAGALLPMIFQNDGYGDPVTTMRQIVWNARAQDQKADMIGIRKRLRDIYDDERGGEHLASTRMLSLYDYQTSVACRFMRRDNVRSSAAYFREFATIRLVVNQALILVFPNNTAYWSRKLDENVKELVAYGNYVIQEDIKADKKSTLFEDLSPEIDKWLGQLGEWRKRQLFTSNQIRDGETVSFVIVNGGWSRGRWLSCLHSGSLCTRGDCSGVDNPMEQGSQYQWRWKCRGEVFWIYALYDRSGFITSCSSVRIKYSYMRGEHWWLSQNVWGTKTAACAGRCDREVWRIYAVGKPCGTTLTDRDRVGIKNEYYNAPVFEDAGWCYWYGCDLHEVEFVIFRSDVPHNSYVENLHCH